MYLLRNLCGINDLATESKVSQNKYFIQLNSIEILNLKQISNLRIVFYNRTKTKGLNQSSIVQKMSLFLTIKQACNIKLEGMIKIEQKLTLAVQNSKSGALLVSKLKFNRIQWNEGYRFGTSLQENVQFILIKGQQKQAQLQQNILGRGKLFTQKFLKMFRQQIQKKQKQKQPFEYQITLQKNVKEEYKPVCVVKIQVQIDPYKKYQGQLITNVDLDLRAQLPSNPKFVKFYLGKTSNINLFSLVDQKMKNPKFRIIQSIYRDIE